jgi:alpha-tubulin suppressor-like RCC1 family protein
VWGWGQGVDGDLGNGDCNPNADGGWACKDSAVPVQVKGLQDVVAVAAGSWTAYALRADGTAWSWGLGSGGALGTGARGCRPTVNWTGGCPSSDVPVQLKSLDQVVAIAAGGQTGYALLRDGTVWSWGSGTGGELGDGAPSCTVTLLAANKCPSSASPVQVRGLTRIVAIAGGASDGYALTAKGTVWAWGANNTGQLGDGACTVVSVIQDNCSGSNVPVPIRGLTAVVAISAGGQGYAIRRDGSAWSWGLSGAQLCEAGPGCPSNARPAKLQGLSQVKAVSAGLDFGYALGRNGAIWSWGFGDFGQLGSGTCPPRVLAGNSCPSSNLPVKVTGVRGAVSVSAGAVGGFALTDNGTVWGWGGGSDGELGAADCPGAALTEGGCANRDVPLEVRGLDDVVAISVGGARGLAIRH